MLSLMFFFGLHVVPQAVAQVVVGRKIRRQLLGEFIGWFRDAARLDSLDLDLVSHRLAGQSLVGEVIGVLHIERAMFPWLSSAEILAEFGDGTVATNLDHDLIDFDGLGVSVLLAVFRS